MGKDRPTSMVRERQAMYLVISTTTVPENGLMTDLIYELITSII